MKIFLIALIISMLIVFVCLIMEIRISLKFDGATAIINMRPGTGARRAGGEVNQSCKAATSSSTRARARSRL